MGQRRLLRAVLVKRRTLSAMMTATLGFSIVTTIRTDIVKLQR